MKFSTNITFIILFEIIISGRDSNTAPKQRKTLNNCIDSQQMFAAQLQTKKIKLILHIH